MIYILMVYISNGLYLVFQSVRISVSTHIEIALHLEIEQKQIFNISDCWSKVYSKLIFHKRSWNYLSHHILCMIFQEKFFLCHVLLTDIVWLSWRLEILGNMCIHCTKNEVFH